MASKISKVALKKTKDVLKELTKYLVDVIKETYNDDDAGIVELIKEALDGDKAKHLVVEAILAKKKKREEGLPKKAKTGYMFFSIEESKKIREALKAKGEKKSLGDISKAVGAKWKAMSDKKKAKYLTKAKDDVIRYKKEIEVWEKETGKIIAKGNSRKSKKYSNLSPDEKKALLTEKYEVCKKEDKVFNLESGRLCNPTAKFKDTDILVDENYRLAGHRDHLDEAIELIGDRDEDEEEKEVEEKISGDIVDVDILKAGHHCSRTASSEMFLNSVKPEIAICSVGEGNKFGHPHDETVEMFKKLNVQYLITYEQGNIVFEL